MSYQWNVPLTALELHLTANGTFCQLLWNCSVIPIRFDRNGSEAALKLLWDSSKTHLKELWRSSGITCKISECALKVFRNSIGAALKWLPERDSVTALKPHSNCSGIALAVVILWACSPSISSNLYRPVNRFTFRWTCSKKKKKKNKKKRKEKNSSLSLFHSPNSIHCPHTLF